jgi:hypothetical protein
MCSYNHQSSYCYEKVYENLHELAGETGWILVLCTLANLKLQPKPKNSEHKVLCFLLINISLALLYPC